MPKCHGRYAMGERGFFFPIVLLVLVGLLSLVGVSVTRSLAEVSAARTSVATQQAFYLAEGGLDAALWWLKSQPSPPSCPNDTYPCTVTPAGNVQSLNGLGSYITTVEVQAANLDSSVKEFVVSSTGTSAGGPVSRTVASRLRTESFARFAYFSDVDRTEDGNPVWRWSFHDLIDGPYHTNEQLRMWGYDYPDSPHFTGPVSTVAASWRCDGPRGCLPRFDQGIALGAAPIPMPNLSLENLQEHAVVLRGDTTVELSGTSILVTNRSNRWSNYPLDVASTKAIFSEGDLIMTGGTLNGQLTLASEHDIIITGSARYHCNAQDPRNDVDCLNPATGAVAYNDDLLGLVARQRLFVPRSVSGPLTLQGLLVSITKGFTMEDYARRRETRRSVVYLYGGLIHKYAPEWGATWDGSRLGYSAEITYDRRLLNIAPPYCPTSGTYQTVLWEEP